MSVRCRACGRDNVDGAQFCANPDCREYLGWERDAQGPGQGDERFTGRFRVPGDAPPGGSPPRSPTPAGGNDQRVGVRATLADTVLEVNPGSTGSTTLSVYNTGTQVEGLAITMSGPAAAWGAAEPPELSVYPDQTAAVTLRFAPPRAPSCPAGHAWYVVRLDSSVHPGLAVTANGVTAVTAYHEMAAELVPVSSSGRGATRHQVMVHNRGNVVEHARLAAADDEGSFRMELDHTAVDVPPGVVGVPLTVRPRRRWFGRPSSVGIHATVTAEGGGTPIRVDGTRKVVPLFPHWAPIAALVMLLLLGGGGAAIALTSGRPDRSGGQVEASSSPTPPVTTGPSATVGPSPTASPTATVSPSTPGSPTGMRSASTPSDPLDKIRPADCVPHNPASLRIYNAGTIGWRLVETLPTGQEHAMLLLDNQADATAALAVARLSTSHCFIGRGNTRPNRGDYIVEYWKGGTGQVPAIASPDCLPYDKTRLKILNEGTTGWLLTDGSSRMLILDNQQDANNALILAQAHSRHCFIGRGNSRPNRVDYIVEYWLR